MNDEVARSFAISDVKEDAQARLQNDRENNWKKQ